uniref:Transmembrane protein n=1 Tax=Ascaris lumbricoides TaxID=6252 RepID=A0A0M3IJ01_ASCLU
MKMEYTPPSVLLSTTSYREQFIRFSHAHKSNTAPVPLSTDPSWIRGWRTFETIGIRRSDIYATILCAQNTCANIYTPESSTLQTFAPWSLPSGTWIEASIKSINRIVHAAVICLMPDNLLINFFLYLRPFQLPLIIFNGPPPNVELLVQGIVRPQALRADLDLQLRFDASKPIV